MYIGIAEIVMSNYMNIFYNNDFMVSNLMVSRNCMEFESWEFKREGIKTGIKNWENLANEKFSYVERGFYALKREWV